MAKIKTKIGGKAAGSARGSRSSGSASISTSSSSNKKSLSKRFEASDSEDDYANEEEDDEEQEQKLKSREAEGKCNKVIKRRNESDKDDSEDSDGPEEIKTSSAEMDRLRAAFEEHYGGGKADTSSKKGKKGKAKDKAKKDDFSVNESEVFNPALLAALDSDALQGQTIDVRVGDEDEDENEDEDADTRGLVIDKNARKSVRLVEGNIEVHVLGKRRNNDMLTSFIGARNTSSTSTGGALKTLLSASDRPRVSFSSFRSQKSRSAAKVFTLPKKASAERGAGKGKVVMSKAKAKLVKTNAKEAKIARGKGKNKGSKHGSK